MNTENVTINKLELASELAHLKLIEFHSEDFQIYENEDDAITVYTDKAQDIFNEYYDKFLCLIESCKIN